MGSSLPGCDEADLHPAASAWSIVAVGEKDPKDPSPLEVTYPSLYNCFGALRHLKFETQAGETDLDDYLAFVESGDYLSPAQKKAKSAGKTVRDPGPYAALGQALQTVRKLTPAAAIAMDRFHARAVAGKRIFFSYKWADVERYARDVGQTRVEWVEELNRRLDQAGYLSWLDHHQILTDRDIGGLLDELLADAVHQSVVFVALLSENYGTGWTRKEWERGRVQLENPKRKDKLLPIVLDSGGEPRRLGLTRKDTIPIAHLPTPGDIVEAIERRFALQVMTPVPDR